MLTADEPVDQPAQCLVCAKGPTVKSHIFPRALMHDLRAEGAFVHQIVDGSSGTKYLQSGPFDDGILCSEHESAMQSADKYAVEFCRRVRATLPQFDGDNYVPNPKPKLLVRFAYQTIWRFCASGHGRELQTLGPYEPEIRSAIFEGGDSSIPMLIARNHLLGFDGLESTIAIAPFPIRLAGIRAWLFAVGGVHFYVKLDRRPFPADGDEFIANNTTSVRLSKLDAMSVHETPMLQNLLSNIK